MSEVPHTVERLSVGWNRRWVTKAALGSLPMAALCGWLAYALVFEGFGDLSASGRVMLAVMFAVFALLFVSTALTYAMARLTPGDVLTLGPEGLHDQRLTRAPIPWSAITGLMPLQRGSQLMLVLAVADAKTWPGPRHPLWAVNRAAARLTGATELAVKVTGLEIDLPGLIDAIQRRAS